MLYCTILLILYNALCYTGYNTEPVPNRPSACPGQLLACSYPVSIHRFLIIGLFTFREGAGRAGRRGAACAFRARRRGIRSRLAFVQGVDKLVNVLVTITSIVHCLTICSWAVAPAPLVWLEVLVPSFNREEELAPPLFAIVELVERPLVERLMCQIRTILESCNENQPLEVGNELRADEVLVRTRNLLHENVPERAARRGNQSAQVD